MGRIVQTVIVMLALSVVCDASVEEGGRPFEPEELGRVVDWAMTSGKATVIRGHIADAFGLGSVDIPVRERGFKAAGQDLTEVVAVASKTPGIVFLARLNEDNGEGIVWRTSPEGQLVATVEFDSVAGAKLVSNFGREAGFQVAKQYFIEKARATDPSARNLPPRGVLSSELTALAVAPWAVVGILIAIIMGCQKPTRRR